MVLALDISLATALYLLDISSCFFHFFHTLTYLEHYQYKWQKDTHPTHRTPKNHLNQKLYKHIEQKPF